ncbi:MAG: hypothetical protein ACOVLD_09605 [Bacteroidia bacterium]|jgi:hypothetical protein
MKVTVNVKLVNSEFDHDIAIALYEGDESEENIKYLWEDEFEVLGDIESFKVKNNAIYTLEGMKADDIKFSFEIWDMTIVECIDKEGKINQFSFSKKLVKSTEKLQDEKTKDIIFNVLLTDKLEHVNPMDGLYILKSNFPKELL